VLDLADRGGDRLLGAAAAQTEQFLQKRHDSPRP
jgi:hypothetical protein